MRAYRAVGLVVLLSACATESVTPDPNAPKGDDGTAGLAEERDIVNRVRRGEGEAVRTELKARFEQNPKDGHVAFLQAVAGMPSEESWKAFKRQADDVPSDPWPVIAMGQTYIAWKMYPQAQKSFTDAAALKPDYVPTRLGEADLLRLSGDAPGAKAGYEAILKGADVPEAHAGLGLLAAQAGDKAAAQRELAIAVKGDPGALEPQRALGKLLLDAGDSAGALAAMKAVVAMDPRDGDAILQLAKLEDAQGDAPGAWRDYQRAAEKKGVDIDIAQRMLAVADKLNDPKAVDHALDQLSHIDKQNPAPLIRMAEIAAAKKDNVTAEARYKEALERGPGNVEVQLALARMYRDAGRTIDAVEMYRTVAATPGSPPAAASERDALLAPLKLPVTPISGDINKINLRFGLDLNHFYQERLKENRGLKGKMRIEVDVDKDGKIKSVNILEDTVKDDLLHLHAYFAMRGVEFPKAARKPAFEYELKP
jgi:tetratricopeptide (TPR) repeat protein